MTEFSHCLDACGGILESDNAEHDLGHHHFL